MSEEKSYKPTLRRLKKAREEGRVLKSSALSASAAAIGCFFGLLCLIGTFWLRNQILLEYNLLRVFQDPVLLARDAGREVLHAVIIILLPGAVAAVGAEIFQVGWKVEFKPLAIKGERLNACSGITRSITGLRSAWLPAVRVTVLLAVIIWCGWRSTRRSLTSIGNSSAELLQSFLEMSGWLFGIGCLLLVLFGVLEYAVKRHEFFRELSMSSDEIRRERKEVEGDPAIQAAQRAFHQELFLRELTRRVRRARVIVVEKLQS